MLLKALGIALFLISTVHAKFSNESEVSIVVNDGNSQLETYHLKSESSYDWKKNKVIFDGQYLYGESQNIRSAEEWSVLGRYERSLSERFALFLGELIESNRFAGYRRRFNTDLGTKISLSKNDYQTTSGEVGYRYTIEKKHPRYLGETKSSKGRLYLETNWKVFKESKFKLWGEYIPNFTESKDYLLNFEASLGMALNHIFSLKLSYKWMYDNFPPEGKKKHDTLYSTSLVASF